MIRLRAGQATARGEFARAEQLLGRSRVLNDRLGEADAPGLYLAGALPLRIAQDRALELIDPLRMEAERSATRAPWRAALTLVLAKAGEHEAARRELRTLTADACRGIPRLDDWLAAMSMLADASADLREAHAAAAILDLLAAYEHQIAVFFYSSGLLGPVSRTLGRLKTLLGQLDQAVTTLERTLERTEVIGAHAWSARARADLAAALITRDGPGDRARAQRVQRPHAALAKRPQSTLGA